ncbi:c-type cytochrome [Paraburkholderia sp. J69-1]|uniref:c-type cytochrome n=1 Tax=unclassified Paraburkholderia TaxID=2615204 RepID=UPI0039EE7B36
MPLRKILFAILAFIGSMGIAHAANSARPPSAEQSLIDRGRYLAQASDCAACHSVKGAAPFSGGLKMSMPMGAIYSTNITPDPQNGIGRYTEQDFARALREGVAKDGHNLYPAMPYTSYSKISDADVSALYAYFRHGVPPSHRANLAPTMHWPLTMRWPMKIWNAFFLDVQPFTPRSDRSVEWNRGAYLVQGVGHCGACHTPRGAAFQELALDEHGDAFLSGAALDGWFASNLTSNAATGIDAWSASDIASFLKTGANMHATAFGPMTSVINHSTQYLSDQDRYSIAVYLKSLKPMSTAASNNTTGAVDASTMAHGAQIYGNFCVACHLANGRGAAPWLAPLAGNPNVLEQDPLSLINVTLNGTPHIVIDGQPAPYPMPAHRAALSNSDIADVLTYTRNSWGNHAPAVSAHEVDILRKQTGTPQ